MSDKRPDFAAEADRAIKACVGDWPSVVTDTPVALLAERAWNAGRESMREERDAEKCTQCNCFEVFIARLTQQRDKAEREVFALVKKRDEAVALLKGAHDEGVFDDWTQHAEVIVFLAGLGKMP